MAMNPTNLLALGRPDRANLNEVIEETSIRKNKNPQSTLVNVDFSNVHAWDVDGMTVSNVDQRIKHKISLSSLADFLADSDNIKESRVYMPSVFFEGRMVDAVTDWVLSNCSEVLNNRNFICNDDQLTYSVKLGLALDKYYRQLDYDSRDEIKDEIREKIQSVIRGAYFFNNAEIFQKRGCKVLVKNELIRAKALSKDSTHRRAVGRLRENIGNIEYGSDMLMAQLACMNISKRELCTAEQQLAEIQKTIMQMRNVLERETSQYRKCDMDSYIVAESMTPETVEAFDNQVFFTGDGDFEFLYRKLAEQGKNIVVVSPEGYLSRSIMRMEKEGILTTHRPNFVDDIWR